MKKVLLMILMVACIFLMCSCDASMPNERLNEEEMQKYFDGMKDSLPDSPQLTEQDLEYYI